MTTEPKPSARASHAIRDVTLYFLRLGTLGFGGPMALVGQMERDLVDGRKWLIRAEMRNAIAVCQSLPGPLAIQVGIYISYLLSARRLLGRLSGRVGLHLAKFCGRVGAGRALCGATEVHSPRHSGAAWYSA